MEAKYNILLVDDDIDIIEFMQYNLKNEGFNVKSANNSEEAFQQIKEFTPHLILLDVMMPGMDGIELCSEFRKISSLNSTIIAFLTARGEDYSQIAGFEAGADDYITKPIKPKLLVSRVKALLKRFSNPSPPEHILEDKSEFKNLTIDKSSYTLSINNEEKKLPKKEFEILYLLASKSGRIFTREQIYHNIWGTDVIVGDRTIDVHIRKLREAIGSDRIQTVKGVGCKFVE